MKALLVEQLKILTHTLTTRADLIISGIVEHKIDQEINSPGNLMENSELVDRQDITLGIVSP